jgi:hypothetical protein
MASKSDLRCAGRNVDFSLDSDNLSAMMHLLLAEPPALNRVLGGGHTIRPDPVLGFSLSNSVHI